MKLYIYNPFLIILALLFFSCTSKKPHDKSQQTELTNKKGQTVTISRGDIEAVFIDNQAYGE